MNLPKELDLIGGKTTWQKNFWVGVDWFAIDRIQTDFLNLIGWKMTAI